MPVLPPAIFLVIVAGWKVLREQRVRAVRWMTAAVAILLLAAVSVWHVEAARDSWRTSDVRLTRRPSGFLDAIRKLPPGSAVFTNAPQFVYERTRRFAVTLPPRTSIWSGDPNPDYSRDRAAIGPALCRHAGVVALANGYLMAGGGAVAARDLGEATNLEVTQRFPEGIIMRVDPARCS